MYALTYMWYKNVGASFFSFVTKNAFDRQTDRRTDRKALQYRESNYMQSHGKNQDILRYQQDGCI